MTPAGPPHIEAFSLIMDDEFQKMAKLFDALTVRIKRPGFSHVISAMVMITDEKMDGYSKIWLWFHSYKVVMPLGVDLLVSDIEGFNSLEADENPFADKTLFLIYKKILNKY